MVAARGIPLYGDRGAWDTENYASQHAVDIYDSGVSPRYHWTQAQLDLMYAPGQVWDIDNVAVGLGYDATGKTGDHNYFAGHDAALSLTIGHHNVIIGNDADLDSGGDYSVSIGYATGSGSTYNYSDVYIGSYAGADNDNSWGNVGIGDTALSNLTGYYVEENVVIGYTAAYGYTTFDFWHNVVIGSYAGTDIYGDVDDAILIGNYTATYADGDLRWVRYCGI